MSPNVIRANTCLSASSDGSCRLDRVCSLSESWCFLPEATSSPWCHRYAERLGGDRLLSIHALRGPECYRDIRTSIFHHSLPQPTLFSFRFLVSLPFCEHHSTRTRTQHCLGQGTWPYMVSAQFMSLWQNAKDRTSPLGHKIPWQASWALGL